MTRRKRVGDWAILYAEIPPELKARLEAQADRNRRTTTAELIVVLEKALDPPPPPEPKKGGKKS